MINRPICLAIVDDRQALRQTLSEKLAADSSFKVIFTASNGEDFLNKLKEEAKFQTPDLVLMDIDMPIMNGIDAVKNGKDRFPEMKFIMLTIFDEDEKIFAAIRAGANGYLLKDEPIEKIKEAIKSLIIDDGAPMSPSIARKTLSLLNRDYKPEPSIADKANQYNLSQREKEVLELLVNGLEYKDIAIKTGVSPNTVRNHISNIYRKLHVSSKIQAVNVYLNNFK